MMCKLAFVLFVCILKTCAMGVNGICCEKIKALVKRKEEGFITLCVQRNTLPRDCCDNIKKELASFEDAYTSLCGNISEICRNPQPLGMESKKIPDIEITASSTYAGDYYPYYARPGSDKCWYPENGKQKNSWIQVDLGKLTRFTGLETQGCASGWTKTYSFSFSADGKRWFSHTNGALKVFQGNTDATSKVRKSFKVPVKARYIRWFPITWEATYPLIRMELYGCPL